MNAKGLAAHGIPLLCGVLLGFALQAGCGEDCEPYQFPIGDLVVDQLGSLHSNRATEDDLQSLVGAKVHIEANGDTTITYRDDLGREVVVSYFAMSRGTGPPPDL